MLDISPTTPLGGLASKWGGFRLFKTMLYNYPMSKYSVILILGPAGAGETTISKMLAQKFYRSVFIETDKLRHMVKNGHQEPWIKAGQKELFLSTKNVASLANNFIKDKFNVIIEDVVTSKERLDMYLKLLKNNKVKIILLLPSKNVLKLRDKSRIKEDRMGKRALQLYDMFTKRLNEEKRWNVLDTSNEKPKTTLKRILRVINKQLKQNLEARPPS